MGGKVVQRCLATLDTLTGNAHVVHFKKNVKRRTG